jgi:flavin reductase (DIM6/NTAB) family NADH-FMN oxidoreductase RutF|tara:strand:+ start:295 stop:768 length:474 start_codon:yes stop_codon:yes gene_type:complete
MSYNEKLGKALGRVPSGLFILTAHFDGRDDAVLASWVSQCSFEPPTVSVVLAKARPARVLIEASGAFILNVLGQDCNDFLKRFAKLPKDEPLFEGLEVRKGYKDVTILEDAVSFLECELINQTVVEDHVIYVGKIIGGEMLKGGEPYVHIRKSGFSY